MKYRIDKILKYVNKHNRINKILQHINENKILNLSVNDFIDDLEDETDLFKPTIKKNIGNILYQKYVMISELSRQTFIHELCKRLQFVNKTAFNKYNYIVPYKEDKTLFWPYLFLTNTNYNYNKNYKAKTKFKDIFLNDKWNSINDNVSELVQVVCYDNNIGMYNISEQMKQIIEKNKSTLENQYNNWRYDIFNNNYEQFVNILKYIFNKNQLNDINVKFISFSKDGAFFAIYYTYYNNNFDILDCYGIYSTEYIVNNEDGINVHENESIDKDYNKFKKFLLSQNVKIPSIMQKYDNNGNLSYSYTYITDIDFDFRKPDNIRLQSCIDFILNTTSLKTSKQADLFVLMHQNFNNTYYVSRTVGDIYIKLSINNNHPFIITAGADGKYLIAYYCIYKDYRKYQIIYNIIDNRDYSILSKDMYIYSVDGYSNLK